mmetsp:Transcript_19842/g.39325  ORF Transcript_19842/g.39325 Transcript_19842/m.39325 type:complete len:96 (-) Transcript_19842:8-295(-)
MCVPPKPQTAQQLFQLARSEELKAGDPKADVSKKRLKADGEAHKAANDGEWGEFDSAAGAVLEARPPAASSDKTVDTGGNCRNESEQEKEYRGDF